MRTHPAAVHAGVAAILLLSAALPVSAAENARWLTAGTLVSFHGSVACAARDEAAAEPEKSFDLTLLVASADAEGAEIYWLLDEVGRGGWSWIDRAGRWTLDAKGATAGVGPALLYDRGEDASTIGLIAPLLHSPEPLAAGVEWSVGSLKHEVLSREPLLVSAEQAAREVDVWKIAAADNYGYKRTLWVDDAGQVLRLSERVFMGRGEEHELAWQVAAIERLTPEESARRSREFAAFLDLAGSLKREPRSQQPDLKPAELAALELALPQAEAAIAFAPLAKLVAAAKSDLAVQTGRAGDVADLAARYENKPAPDFSLEGLAGARLSSADLKGAVTILHFWEYRDEPLREPYGQIGYLDFLYGRRKADGARVYGVAVDARLADESKRAAGVRSAAKLASFMNLGYPLLLDAGGALKQFGDPRLLGAQLPLFVVIDAQGKIAHYHVGLYDVDRDAGLKQLDEVVGELLKTR